MPTTKECISDCVNRLVRLPGQTMEDFDVKPQQIRDDMGRALQRHTRDDQHARRVTDAIIEQCKKRPTPAEIREFCDGVPAEQPADRRPNCRACSGSGFDTEWRLVTYRGGSFEIEKSERLDLDYEAAREFRQKLSGPNNEVVGMKRQDVLSSARICGACNGSGKRAA